jgi:hypothetical protein
MPATSQKKRKSPPDAAAVPSSTTVQLDGIRQHPVQLNRGGGGPAYKVAAFDKASELSRRKKTVDTAGVPDPEPLNLMAPGPTQNKRQKSSLPNVGNDAHTHNLADVCVCVTDSRSAACACSPFGPTRFGNRPPSIRLGKLWFSTEKTSTC